MSEKHKKNKNTKHSVAESGVELGALKISKPRTPRRSGKKSKEVKLTEVKTDKAILIEEFLNQDRGISEKKTLQTGKKTTLPNVFVPLPPQEIARRRFMMFVGAAIMMAVIVVGWSFTWQYQALGSHEEVDTWQNIVSRAKGLWGGSAENFDKALGAYKEKTKTLSNVENVNESANSNENINSAVANENVNATTNSNTNANTIELSPEEAQKIENILKNTNNN